MELTQYRFGSAFPAFRGLDQVAIARPDDSGDVYYSAVDVDALRARIREAVAAEREAPPCLCDSIPCKVTCPQGQARAALDALLSGEG